MTPRLLRAEDAGLGNALWLIQQVFAEHDGRIDPPSSMHRLTIRDMADPTKEVWVIGTEPRAVVILTPQKDALYLGKLAVSPVYRGQGLARELVDHAVSRAASLGFTAIELETRIELVENHAAFAKMGFVKIEENAHPGYDRPTSVKMRRTVV